MFTFHRLGGRFSYTGGQSSTPWIAYVGLAVLVQCVFRVAITKVEEDKSMGKAIRQFKLFLFSVMETITAIQINAVSSVVFPFS